MVHFTEINQTPPPYPMLQDVGREATPKLAARNCPKYLQATLIMGWGVLVSEFMWSIVGPNTLKLYIGSDKKLSKTFSSLFHIKWDLILVSRPYVGRIIPASQVLVYWGNLVKLGLNTPNHVQGHVKSNPKS